MEEKPAERLAEFYPVEPAVTVARDPKTGRFFFRPSDECIYYLERLFPMPREYYFADPVRKREEFGWPDVDVLLNQAREFFLVDPRWWPWLKDLSEMLKKAKAKPPVPP